MASKPFTTRVIEGELPRCELEAAELRIVAGPDRGFKQTLGIESLLIGSARQCDIVLHDSTVSSRHAEIVARDGRYTLRDLQSTNGVMLGAHRVERVPLCDGMRLQLGESGLVFRPLGGKLAVALVQAGHTGALVAHSVKMRAFVAALQDCARSDVIVLLEGETGTGKELAAATLHELSGRRSGPFVVCDCGGMNRSLMAAELFGYEKGAFTGATESRAGLFEAADGGTLFLDEVGELPLELQPLLLAALERKVVRRLGGKADLRPNVRIVAATHRNLVEEVRAKRFREDLYYRLVVVRLRVPPLRERVEDLALLAEAFAREAGAPLSPELMIPLRSYDWPGNVRELKNVIQRVAIQPQEARLIGRPRRDEVPASDSDGVDVMFDEQGRMRSLKDVRRLTTEAFERRYLECVLSHAHGKLSCAAEIAGVTRQSLTELALKHGLHPRRPR